MIELAHLSKAYGATTVVHDLSLTCRPGTITGFLGPNGAGKSTTLRMLTGLTQPTSGTALVAGVAYRCLTNPARVVGVMLDATTQHDGRTGRETLQLAASVMGARKERAEAVLGEIGLGDDGHRRVGRYSLGMRQRLGLGVALLGDPSVLVLDEPGNGLDPDGIRWLRRSLRTFADRGGTVLLSSHLLAEVATTADHVAVLLDGRLVASGRIDTLLNQTSSVPGVALEEWYFDLVGGGAR